MRSPAAAWDAPRLRAEAVQNPDGTVRLASAADEARVLRYLRARAARGGKATPVVAFLPKTKTL